MFKHTQKPAKLSVATWTGQPSKNIGELKFQSIEQNLKMLTINY